mmetsp:Transcript_574/g.871  ORF Transcript_574/g.871 Transcript_574/m.871 type:complete len:400 (+) Transcript_574:85-1284(+)|eukprot:CAMPEP_0178683478 /NCGR_PEP_ID=MMETSP0699-20121125/2329_1 /TAXON_ID=265572 /ORGANISM="Extubocellulus spinifer, Strain CCMP396" /LENGTH=399 /DNA_ID=CAMNT_0020328083 /DNA_START=18 /DNA_END=1217 /DNA_ORIENTATION=+
MWGGMPGAPPPPPGGHYGPGGGVVARPGGMSVPFVSIAASLLRHVSCYLRLLFLTFHSLYMVLISNPLNASTAASATGGGGGGGQQQRHDIFVGNLAFNTTEEQLHQAFSELGRIVKVRMVTDQETGKPRGFAFIEFEDPQAALSAIRNMNDYELNGRRIRVNFSNSSHLEALAGKLGMDMSAHTQARQQAEAKKAAGASAGSVLVADALKSMGKGDMYDIIKQLKDVADKDPDEARKLLCGHPQLPEAILFLMSKLDMVKTPVATGPIGVPGADMAGATAAAPARPADPRAGAAAAASAVAAAPSDPRARDPRAAARAAQQQAPPPPPSAMQQQPPPPRPGQYGAPPPAALPVVAGVDPALVRQVMSLTPEQIAGIPDAHQRQSIIDLRNKITGVVKQ